MSVESRMATLEAQLQSLSDNVNRDRSATERAIISREKAERAIFIRLQWIERTLWAGLGGLGTLQIILQFWPNK